MSTATKFNGFDKPGAPTYYCGVIVGRPEGNAGYLRGVEETPWRFTPDIWCQVGLGPLQCRVYHQCEAPGPHRLMDEGQEACEIGIVTEASEIGEMTAQRLRIRCTKCGGLYTTLGLPSYPPVGPLPDFGEPPYVFGVAPW